MTIKRGPAKKPTALRMIDNARIKKIPESEPKPLLMLPRAPVHLSHKAKLIWRRMGKILLKLGLITEADEATFAMWCTSYAELQKLEVEVQTEEFTYTSATGNILPNPKFYLLFKVRAQVERYGTRFGMSPSARAGITVSVRDESNPYRAWQQGRVTNGGKKKVQKTNQAK